MMLLLDQLSPALIISISSQGLLSATMICALFLFFLQLPKKKKKDKDTATFLRYLERFAERKESHDVSYC